MKGVADALERLPNDDARARVLRWVAEHFSARPDYRSVSPQEWLTPETDPRLTVPSADELEMLPVPTVDDEDDSVVHFSAVEQRAAAPEDPSKAGRHADARDAESDEARGGSLESLLRGFVDEFQRFLVDWDQQLTKA